MLVPHYELVYVGNFWTSQSLGEGAAEASKSQHRHSAGWEQGGPRWEETRRARGDCCWVSLWGSVTWALLTLQSNNTFWSLIRWMFHICVLQKWGGHVNSLFVCGFKDAKTYAEDTGLLFMETSAKTAINVNELFLAIGEGDACAFSSPQNG